MTATSTPTTIETGVGPLRLDLLGNALAQHCTARREDAALWYVSSPLHGKVYLVLLLRDDAGPVEVCCSCPAGIQEPPVACKHAALVFALWLSGAVPVPPPAQEASNG